MSDARKVTIKDVAADAGVSIATISRVVHGLPVNAVTRARVEVSLASLRYAPNLAARSLRTRSSRTIACSARSMLRTSVTPLLASIERTAREAGYTLLLTATEESIQGQRNSLQLLASRGLDGLIFSGAAEHDPILNEALSSLNIPVVLLDRDPTPTIDAVTVAHAHSIEASVRHLHQLGHRKIALLTVPGNLLPGRERTEAYQRALRSCRLKWNPAWFSDHCVDERSTYQLASCMFGLRDRPTAIIAGGTTLLSPVLRAARQHRLQVGRDLSVIAGSDSELAAIGYPGITATQWDVAEWGRIATHMLLERILHPDLQGGRHVVMPTELVIRDSTTAPNGRTEY